jgi:hypothetical protein
LLVATSAALPPVVHLSQVVGGALRDETDERLGRVDDLIVRMGGTGYPPITGFLVTVAGRQSYLPSERVSEIASGAVTLSTAKLDLRPFERRPEEVLLKHDVLDHQLINVDGARLVRANEVELARVEGWWRVVGVDTGGRGAARRLLPRALGRRIATGEFLDWASVEPFAGNVPAVRLRVLHPKLARLHREIVRSCPEGGATPSDRPELSSMADDYARHALSQRAAFEATHPAALAAARLFADEPVLRVVDLGAADGVNPHGLIRDLADERAGRPLIYALVDLPTNAWGVAADHLRHAFDGAVDGPRVLVIPAPGDAGPGVADAGTGANASPEAHGEACRRAVEQSPPPAVVISMAGIPLEQTPCLPSDSVHPVHRRAPGLPRSVPGEDRALRASRT